MIGVCLFSGQILSLFLGQKIDFFFGGIFFSSVKFKLNFTKILISQNW
jgi:hypothetical protein